MTAIAPAEFLGELLGAGLLIETGVRGVYGHGGEFERARAGLDRALGALARVNGAERLQFPPVLPRVQLERSGYLSSFPHLAGSVFSFAGGEPEAVRQAELAEAHGDWSGFQAMTDVALMPAACYPIYPAIAARGPLAAGGAFVDAGGSWVFRHEPSDDPTRRQMFHQHELVRIGEPEPVAAWRDEWAQRGLKLLCGLGLDARLSVATDPFFGRRGRLLAANQRDQALKLELLIDIVGDGPTACASFNQHRDHFAAIHGLVMHDGSPAHTACVGFGHERIVMALIRRHGSALDAWPQPVRRQLWADGDE